MTGPTFERLDRHAESLSFKQNGLTEFIMFPNMTWPGGS